MDRFIIYCSLPRQLLPNIVVFGFLKAYNAFNKFVGMLLIPLPMFCLSKLSIPLMLYNHFRIVIVAMCHCFCSFNVTVFDLMFHVLYRLMKSSTASCLMNVQSHTGRLSCPTAYLFLVLNRFFLLFVIFPFYLPYIHIPLYLYYSAICVNRILTGCYNDYCAALYSVTDNDIINACLIKLHYYQFLQVNVPKVYTEHFMELFKMIILIYVQKRYCSTVYICNGKVYK